MTMTKDELKLELDALGVEYPKDAKLAELEALYAPYAPSAAPCVDAGDTGGQNAPEAPEDARLALGAALFEATVGCARLNVRDEPGGAIVCELKEGQPVEVLSEGVDGWSHIRLDAWARSEFLTI